MGLSNDLVSQFVKVTKDVKKSSGKSTIYGTTVEYNGKTYVKLDGSELLTPISTIVVTEPGERVLVSIDKHAAIITGNISSPAARIDTVLEIAAKADENGNKIVQMNNTITQVNNTILSYENRITLIDNQVVMQGNTITQIHNTVVSQGNDIKLINSNIDIYNSSFQIKDGIVTGIKGIDSEWITTEQLEAYSADIKNLKVDKLDADSADLKYANIDFTNIGKAAMEYFYANSGLIKNVVVGDQTITGELIGVTIKGDLIEGNTVVADKLVIKGEDGLYYKLNTDGMTVETKQTEYNSLNGSVIISKSITATKISVEDLVAFDATIGGINITNSSIYSGVKESVNNTTRGLYMDKDGQVAFGDATNYLKYYKNQNGEYRLEISAKSVTMNITGETVEDAMGNMIISAVEQFYQSDSPTSLSGGSWSESQPIWMDGKYIWRRTAITYGNGNPEYTPSATGVCITGNTGARGLQGLQGEKGEQGIQGPKGDTGANGKSSYFHIKYSSVANPISSSQMTETPSTYIGTYVDFVETDSSDPSKYTWSRFEGIQGADGEQGIPGTNGADGKTSYLHIAYANSADGATGFSVSDSIGKLYIGQYTDFVQSDSTDYTKYSWTKIKGDTGATGAAGKDANQVVHTFTGSAGTAGYVAFATVTVSRMYVNAPVSFRIANRSAEMSDVQFAFVNANSTDPGLDYLRSDGGVKLWMQKTATSTWRIIAQKSDAYDNLCVFNLTNPPHNGSGITIVGTNTHLTSVPSSTATNPVVSSDYLSAARTATNYLNYDSNGLLVGNCTTSTLGKNILIGSNAIDFRDGSTILASYGSNTIYLGKNNRNTMIDLCNGEASLYRESADTTGTYWSRFVLDTKEEIYLVTSHRIAQEVKFVDDNGTTGMSCIDFVSYDTSYSETTAGGMIELYTSTISSAMESVSSRLRMRDGNTYICGDGNNTSTAIELCGVDGYAKLEAKNYSDNGISESYITIHGNGVITMDGTRINASPPIYASDKIVLSNLKRIYGLSTAGSEIDLLCINNANNTILGYGGYAASLGRTHIYGNDIYLFSKAAGASYKPYYAKGDNVSGIWWIGGWVSSASKNIYFTIPLSKPIIGSPTVTVTSVNGLIIRQNGQYTHGTSASAYVQPSSYSAVIDGNGNCIRITAIMSTTTNAANNDVCGVAASIKITFS